MKGVRGPGHLAGAVCLWSLWPCGTPFNPTEGETEANLLTWQRHLRDRSCSEAQISSVTQREGERKRGGGNKGVTHVYSWCYVYGCCLSLVSVHVYVCDDCVCERAICVPDSLCVCVCVQAPVRLSQRVVRDVSARLLSSLSLGGRRRH